MCLLPLANTNFSGLAYKKGIRYFDCGACPECLKKRANMHALTSVYEAREHAHNCMITLTYDSFLRDALGNILYDKFGKPIENPVDPNLKVNVKHVQDFIKRLRSYIKYHYPDNESIKYRVAAEYGSRTHRAHYHLLIFGFDFPDRHFYKKSSRGNPIYMSSVLTKLWGRGICTVDSVRVHSAVARYCSKYLAKSRSDKTFSLSSQHLGFNGLIRDFNGLNYMIDGREYTVPRFIWEYYIVNKYQNRYRFLKNVPVLSPKYVNRDRNLSDCFQTDVMFEYNKKQRAFYRCVRDRDPLYVKYLEYWYKKSLLYERLRLPARARILSLPESKYHFYKVRALEVFDKRMGSDFEVSYVAPDSGCVTAYFRDLERIRKYRLPFISCPNRASDRKFVPKLVKYRSRMRFLPAFFDEPPIFVQFAQQLSIDNL